MSLRVGLLFLLAMMPRLATAGPLRIVPLNPLIAEWTAEILGPEYSTKKIVAVSEYSDHPESLKSLPTVGPYPKISVERVAALKPDLVLASEEYNLPEQLDQIRRLKLNLKVLPRERFVNFGSWIELLGKALHEEARAKRVRKKWDQDLALLQSQKGPQWTYFFEVQHEPLIGVGGDSFITDALTTVGYANIFKDLRSGYPKVSTESVVKANPDFVFLLGHEQGAEELERARQGWRRFNELKAVKTSRVQVLSGDDFARCSLRLLNALKRLKSGHGP
jgi:ABC-type Fe3+-hydroxamate transport system substrate-binding protein